MMHNLVLRELKNNWKPNNRLSGMAVFNFNTKGESSCVTTT